MTIKVTDSNLLSEVQKGITLVEFWAPWCGPCKMLGPVLEELEERCLSRKLSHLTLF